MNKENISWKCVACGYSWISRKENPRMCPGCKKQLNDNVFIPMHNGKIKLRVRKGKKYSEVNFDLWYINFNVKEESGNKLLKEYEDYFQKSNLKSTGYYSLPKTYIYFRVENKDLEEWKNKIIDFLKDKSNLEPIML